MFSIDGIVDHVLKLGSIKYVNLSHCQNMTIDAESRLRARSIECLFEGVPGVDPLVSLNQPLSEALTSLSDVELDLNETL